MELERMHEKRRERRLELRFGEPRDGPHARRRELRRTLFWGLGLILVGGAFLAERYGFVDEDQVLHFWPALIALHGALMIAFATHLSQALEGVFSIVVAFWVYACLEHLWGWTFLATWPIVLISAGAVMLLRGLLQRENGESTERTP